MGPSNQVGKDRGARRRILDAAEELIAENGFDATPTALIAKVAGVPKGLVFHYFPSKTDVLTSLVAERTSFDALDAAEVVVEPGDVARTLSRLADRFHHALDTSVRMRRLLFREAATHPEVGAVVRNLQRAAVAYVRAGLDAALAGWAQAEEIAYQRRDAVAQTFAAVLLQEAGLGALVGTKVDLDAVARLLAEGLHAPPAAPRPATSA